MTASEGMDSLLRMVGGKSEEVDKIVQELDRFLKGVHLDVEDWKLSVEDMGDGTRIFVRFQLHITPPRDGKAAPSRSPPPDAARAAEDPDLAFFVDSWRHEPSTKLGWAYHEEGAPYLEPPDDPEPAPAENSPARHPARPPRDEPEASS